MPDEKTNVTITRKIEFDAGHRIPYHESKCRHIHGHRYVLEATATGPIIDDRNRSDHGMVLDFGNFKAVLEVAVGNDWDHALLVWENDSELIDALDRMPDDHRTVILPDVPTVENLSRLAFDKIELVIKQLATTLVYVRLYETPNCWADAYNREFLVR